MKKFCNFLNKLFDSPKEYIINNNLNKYIRKSKISLEDAIFYRFSYIFNCNSNTLESITSNINFNNYKDNIKHKSFTRIGIYKIEDDTIETKNKKQNVAMLNRCETDGEFGIWGHDIGDLIYNGSGKIDIGDEYIYVNLYCDS